MEELDIRTRVMMVLEHLVLEVQMLEMRNDIQSKVRKDIDRQQREYFLQQQMRTIQDELGDNPQEQDVIDMKSRAEKKKRWGSKDSTKMCKRVLATSGCSVCTID